MQVEQIKMRLEVMKGESLGNLRSFFMRKVQLEDERDDNEVKLHWQRGYLKGLEDAVNAIAEIEKGIKLEELNRQRESQLRQAANQPPPYSASHLEDIEDATVVLTNVGIDKL